MLPRREARGGQPSSDGARSASALGRLSHARVATVVRSVEELVGAHPDALTELFLRGAAPESGELGELVAGRFLALHSAAGLHLLTRPWVRAVARALAPWEGLVFDHGGTAGANRVFGRELLRFRAERKSSWLDAGPALVLSYEEAAWPARLVRDELRVVGDGVAIGPTYAEDRLVAWFGYQAHG